MELVILGTQSPYAKKGKNCPGFLIRSGKNNILLDCGSGVHSMLNFPDDLNNMNVFLSHLHRDHYNDIFNMQYAAFTLNAQKRLKRPIKIYMPKTPERIASDIMEEENSFAEYETIEEDSKIKIGDANISFCKTDHPYETYAIRIDESGRSIVYTSDTSFSAHERLIKFAKGADILISESSLLKEHGFPEINSHLTAFQAGKIAKDANVKSLLLTHFWPEESLEKYLDEAKEIFPKTAIAIEGKRIKLLEKNKDEREI